MKNENIVNLYQNTLQNIHCSDTFKEDLTTKMMQKSSTQKNIRKEHANKLIMGKRFRPAVTLAVTALLLVLLGTNKTIIQAMENLITAGVTYSAFLVEDAANITRAYFDAALFRQEKEKNAADLTEWKETYPDFYAELEQNQMLDVILPHYQMDTYTELEDNYKYIGELKPGEACMGGTFANGDSIYTITILRFPSATATGSIHEMEYHYSLEVNGVNYEVIKVSDDYTYEEYCATLDTMVPVWLEKVFMTEEEFAVWMSHPVHIHVMINDYNYNFGLSTDIPVEEFLATIY